MVVRAFVTQLVGTVFGRWSTDAQNAYHKRQLWSIQILPYIADEVSQCTAVLIVASWLVAIWISPSVDHIVPALEPSKSGDLVADGSIVFGDDSLEVTEYKFHMIDHLAVVHPGLLGFICLDRSKILTLFLQVAKESFVEDVRTCARWAKVRVQAFASPRGLDDQNRCVGQFLHGQSEGKLGPDFFGGRAKASRQLAGLFGFGASDRRNPDAVADLGFAIGPEHFVEHRLGRRIHADVFKGADFGMALHV